MHPGSFWVHLVVILVLVSSQLGDSSDDSTSPYTTSPAYPSRPYSASSESDEGEPASPTYDAPQNDDSTDEEYDPIPPTTVPEFTPTPTPTPTPISTPTPIPPSTPIPPQGSIVFSMKLLLVGTSATDTYFLAAKLTLDSVGAPYDTLFMGSTPDLSSANGGKYGGIIVAASSSLDTALSEALNGYQLAFGVRKVSLYATPVAPGMQLLGSFSSQVMSFKVQAANYTNGVQLSFSDTIPFGYRTSVLDSLTVTPVVMGKLYDGSDTIVAAAIQRPDGTKTLEYYVPPTVGTGYSLAFGNIWLQWISGGMFIGLRRIIWSIQVDDLFLSTVLFDPATLTQSGATYRCTPADIENLENVLTLVNEYVPGSNVRVEFAFNGAGIQIGGGLATDPLYLEIKRRQNSFFFESHTFTHPLLDTYTYDQTLAELRPNTDVALDFFGTSNSTAYYSARAMISGLFNGEVLRAIAAMGITSVVGDNSRPELAPENKYHGIYTSVAKHGYDGIFIVPRQVTDVYYDVSTPEAEVSQYSQIYGVAKTIHEIVIIQAQLASRNLLAYRHDPFMFHQANLGSYSMVLGGKVKVTSLLSMWIANTFAQLTRFSTLPYWTFKHEDLAEIWKQREVRDNCDVDVQATVINTKITSLNLVSKSSCRYALTGIEVKSIEGITSTEVYGPDLTTWVILTASIPVQLTLSTPLSLL